tara:strand:- start:52 stop:390 length:339 start_codon:yes stop_codon:yes gene_type:complete
MKIDECKDELNQQLVECRGELRENERHLLYLQSLPSPAPDLHELAQEIVDTQEMVDSAKKRLPTIRELLGDIAELQRMASPHIYTNTGKYEFECKHSSVLTSLEEFGLMDTE